MLHLSAGLYWLSATPGRAEDTLYTACPANARVCEHERSASRSYSTITSCAAHKFLQFHTGRLLAYYDRRQEGVYLATADQLADRILTHSSHMCETGSKAEPICFTEDAMSAKASFVFESVGLF